MEPAKAKLSAITVPLCGKYPLVGCTIGGVTCAVGGGLDSGGNAGPITGGAGSGSGVGCGVVTGCGAATLAPPGMGI